jgi:phosphoribosylformimino-5-aminoimidazole carboxamide ribotide isomerase
MTRSEFRVVPAVDVLGSEAVRLLRGDYDDVTLRESDPFGLVARFAAAGPPLVHVVDLSAARSGRVRPEVIARAVAAAAEVPVQAAGGVRTTTDALALVGAGAARVVVGTAAFRENELLDELVALLGDRLVVALDVRDGVVAVEGWTRGSATPVGTALGRCVEAGVPRLACTAIERDGTLRGPSLELLEEACASGLPVLAAGGVRSLEDLEAIESVGCEGAIVGRALLEGSLPLSALRWRGRRVESRA